MAPPVSALLEECRSCLSSTQATNEKYQLSMNREGFIVFKQEKSKDATGFTAVLKKALKNNNDLLGNDKLERALVNQWLEKRVISPESINYLTETIPLLERHLACRSFLVCERLTLADVVWNVALQSTMNTLTFQEKEQFPCISRWYGQVQSALKPNLPNEIIFSRTALY